MLNGQFDKLTDRSKGTPAHELNHQFDKLTDHTGEGTPVPELNGQFDGFGWLTAGKLTDRTAGEPRSLSLPKGPFPNRIFIPSLTHPALKAVFCFVANASACSSFRVYASVFSVFFREIPWLCLCLCFVFFPWLIICFCSFMSKPALKENAGVHLSQVNPIAWIGH